MAKDLERLVVEEKKAVTVKVSVSALNILDAYAKWLNRDRVEVLEWLMKGLLDRKDFAQHLNNGSNGKGK